MVKHVNFDSKRCKMTNFEWLSDVDKITHNWDPPEAKVY